MIEYVHGKLADLSPAIAVVDCQGVGYAVNISLNTYAVLQGKDDVKLWIHEAIRDDAFQLWGFSSKEERTLFTLLISVSGIGAAMARMVLSAFTPTDLSHIISEGSDKQLKQVKGIGPKAAQRIILDLRDKIGTLNIGASSETEFAAQHNEVQSQVMEEAISALTMLGFSPAPSHKVVLHILKEEPGARVERVIKLALKML